MSNEFDFIIHYVFLGSDHQTFSMTLPPRLRDYYDKVVTPASGGNIRFTDVSSFKIEFDLPLENYINDLFFHVIYQVHPVAVLD